jgi:hypothetical protein
MEQGILTIQWWFMPANAEGSYPNDKLTTLTANANVRRQTLLPGIW